MAQSGTLGSSSSSSTLGKQPRYPKSTDTANKHTPKPLTTKNSPSVKDAVASVTREMTLAPSTTIRTSIVQGIGLAVLLRLLLEHLTGELNQTPLFPTESNCRSSCEQMEQKFRRPLSTVRPLPPWMPTPAAITMISLAEKAAQEDAATKTLEAMGTEAGSTSTKLSMVLEKVRSV